jgi:hypothetical protein
MLFKAVLETKPIHYKRDVKKGETLRTHYGEDLRIESVNVVKGGIEIKAERWHEGANTGSVTLTISRGCDATFVRGYQRDGKSAVWERSNSQRDKAGHHVEMFYAEFGRGAARATCWEITRDGERAGYAVNQSDADANFRKVLDGYIHNPETGNYEWADE